MLAGFGIGLSVSFVFKIFINLRINKIDNSIKNNHLFNNVNSDVSSFNNNGIQASHVENLVFNQKDKKYINDNEKSHCEYIIKEMDSLISFMDNPFNDPLNNYTGRGFVNGEYNEGDYHNLYDLYDYLTKKSVLFNNEELNNSISQLRSAIFKLYYDLQAYTHPHGRDGYKVRDMWSLYYLLYEHPLIYIVEEKNGEISPEVEKKANEQLHKLIEDKNNLNNFYEIFLKKYNELL